MSYPGTYLKTKEFAKRYEIVAEQLGLNTRDCVIVDLNCGEPGLCRYIDYKEYHCNDVFVPDNIEGVIFRNIKDDHVDIKPDILVCFGYGAGEFTKHPMESKTIGESILRLAKYRPKFIVIEMAQKWENDFKIISSFKQNLSDYSVFFEKKFSIGNPIHYHDNRQIVIFKISNHDTGAVPDVELSDN